MHRAIQPLLPGGRRVVGTAVTLAIAGRIRRCCIMRRGCCGRETSWWSIAWGDDKYACWGGGVAVAVKATGVVAVDGPCTDLAEIIASDFPIWARGLAPITTRLYDLGGGMNVPVSCGGAVVMPGDAVLADESGVLVIPRDEVLAVAERALAMQDTGKAREASVRDAGARLGELSGASAKVLAGLGKG